MTDETRTRFLAAIAKQIPADRVIEVHLFPAIKQGGAESGVAVIAVERETYPSLEVTLTEIPIERLTLEDVPSLADTSVEIPTDVDLVPEGAAAREEAAAEEEPASEPQMPPSRYTVFSARYRSTLKGPDRGKWEVSVTEEADAPLLTIDAVVRGVQQRSGEADDTVRLSGDEFRSALPAPPPV
ncbi:MAG: hypothetical protein ABJE47_07765 [bacterium]